jgi:hypothetical protein
MKKLGFEKIHIFRRVKKDQYVNLSQFYKAAWEERLNGKSFIRSFGADYGKYLIGYSSAPFGLNIAIPVSFEDLCRIADIEQDHFTDKYTVNTETTEIAIVNRFAGRKQAFVYFDETSVDNGIINISILKWKEHKRVMREFQLKCHYLFEGGE